MAYELSALIAPAGVLGPTVSGIPGAVLVPPAAGLELLPLTDDVLEELDTRAQGRSISFAEPGLQNLRGPAMAAAASADGPVAYVSAAYFGGQGVQMAAVWSAGRPALGPVHCPRCGPDGKIEHPSAVGAINQALRLLGVKSAPGRDEFDTVGLGRKRQTEQWGI
jgi:hypothetical protein